MGQIYVRLWYAVRQGKDLWKVKPHSKTIEEVRYNLENIRSFGSYGFSSEWAEWGNQLVKFVGEEAYLVFVISVGRTKDIEQRYRGHKELSPNKIWVARVQDERMHEGNLRQRFKEFLSNRELYGCQSIDNSFLVGNLSLPISLKYLTFSKFVEVCKERGIDWYGRMAGVPLANEKHPPLVEVLNSSYPVFPFIFENSTQVSPDTFEVPYEIFRWENISSNDYGYRMINQSIQYFAICTFFDGYFASFINRVRQMGFAI